MTARRTPIVGGDITGLRAVGALRARNLLPSIFRA